MNRHLDNIKSIFGFPTAEQKLNTQLRALEKSIFKYDLAINNLSKKDDDLRDTLEAICSAIKSGDYPMDHHRIKAILIPLAQNEKSLTIYNQTKDRLTTVKGKIEEILTCIHLNKLARQINKAVNINIGSFNEVNRLMVELEKTDLKKDVIIDTMIPFEEQNTMNEIDEKSKNLLLQYGLLDVFSVQNIPKVQVKSTNDNDDGATPPCRVKLD